MSEMDFNRLIRVSGAGPEGDFQYQMNLGGFGGRADVVVWDSKSTDKKGPVIKALFTLTSLLQLSLLIEKAINNAEVKPVTLGIWPWDMETKTNVFRASITIGRDAEKCIYMELSGSTHKDPIRFYTITDNSIRINDSELPKQYATELGAKTILATINTILPLASISPKRAPGGAASDSAVTPPISSNDIPF